MKDFILYVITDKKASKNRGHLEVIKAAIDGGADVVQLRDKDASVRELVQVGNEIRLLTHRRHVDFIVNDRVDIALATDADGVHLGQDDLPLYLARKIIGKEKIIGVSTHSLDEAIQAETDGADYIAVGPIFATPTKPDYKPVGLELIRQIKERIKIPFVAIGGIDENNIKDVVNAGATRIAVVRAVVGSDNITQAVRQLKGLIG